MNILEKIALKTKERVDEAKKVKPLKALIEEVSALPAREEFRLEKSIKEFNKKGEMAFICEVKKASPSKGLIAEDFPYVEIAKEYEKAGAAAISVLTEPYFFQGCNEYLKEISENVQTPLLRKDFTTDEYQIYVARLKGASAVLLIAALLTEAQISKFMGCAAALGLDAIVETHTESEVERALRANAKILGVNNRNLKNFEVDLNTTLRLRKMAPRDVVFVSESGIKTNEDIKKLQDNNVSAVLIGETLMKSKDKTKMLQILRGETET